MIFLLPPGTKGLSRRLLYGPQWQPVRVILLVGTIIRNSGQPDGSLDTLEEHRKYVTTTTETRKTIIKEKSQQESTKEIESESRNETLQPESKLHPEKYGQKLSIQNTRNPFHPVTTFLNGPRLEQNEK